MTPKFIRCPIWASAGASLLMHLELGELLLRRGDWPSITHLGVCPAITHAICTNCSICVWIWNVFPEYDWREQPSPRRAVEMWRVFYPSVRLPLYLFFFFFLSTAFRDVWGDFWCEIGWKTKNPIADSENFYYSTDFISASRRNSKIIGITQYSFAGEDWMEGERGQSLRLQGL